MVRVHGRAKKVREAAAHRALKKRQRELQDAPTALPLPRPEQHRARAATWWGIDPCAILAIACAALSMVTWAATFGPDAVFFGALSLDRLRAKRWMRGAELAWVGLLIGISAVISVTIPIPDLKR